MLRLTRREFDLLATTRIVVDERHMSQAAAVFPQHAATIGCVHQIAAVRHPLRRHQGDIGAGAARPVAALCACAAVVW